MEKSRMTRTKTQRGFCLVEFNDLYGQSCSIQESSLADERAIWVGINDPDPMVMASEANRVRVYTEEIVGWIPYPIPPEVNINTKMHLSVSQAKELIEELQRWIDTGTLMVS